MSEGTAYDEFPYRSRAYLESHIDRLHLIGHLFGMDVAPVDGCRVLEIGCADGGNLVPMAERLPGSHFVGIDLAARQIEDGNRWVEPLGLSNVELVHRNFKRIPSKLGNFDYIIVHGVFSWIPEKERAPLMNVLKKRLLPNGVAYVSYNTLPGWSSRRVVRDFLLQHTAEFDELDDKVSHVRTLLQFLHDASNENVAFGSLIRSQCRSLLGTPPQYMLHGLLAEHNDAYFLKDFVSMANDAGLQYLGDAEFESMMPDRLHPEGREAMNSVPGGLIDQEQVQDYLVNRMFRRTLLVHDDVELQRSVPWERTETLFMSAKARLIEGHIDEPGEARFDAPDHVFVTDNPVLKVGLTVLNEVWPANRSFNDWVAATAQRSGRPGVEVRSMLGRNVLPLFMRGVLWLHPRDLKIAHELSAKPIAAPWSRMRAREVRWVTDLRHGMRQLPPGARFLLPYLDGTKSHKQLYRLLDKEVRHGRVTAPNGSEQLCQEALQGLLTRSLLVG